MIRFGSLALGALLASGCSSSSAGPGDPAGAVAPTDPGPAAAGPAANAAAQDGGPRPLPPNGSKGCGTSPPSAGQLAGLTIDVAGQKRGYALSVPPEYDAYRAYPLVFVFHSGGGSGARQRDYFGLEKIAGSEALFVYPDGINGNWDLDDPSAKNRDVALFDALVAGLGASHCVDATRVFVTGSSNGAYFTNQIGCRRGGIVRAIAPHAGGGPFETSGSYDAQGHLVCEGKPVAAMVFIGLADTNVAPSEGEKSLAHWSWANGCAAKTDLTSPNPCVAYAGCARPVVGCKIPGVGHRIWDQGPKATWDFFASFAP